MAHLPHNPTHPGPFAPSPNFGLFQSELLDKRKDSSTNTPTPAAASRSLISGTPHTPYPSSASDGVTPYLASPPPQDFINNLGAAGTSDILYLTGHYYAKYSDYSREDINITATQVEDLSTNSSYLNATKSKEDYEIYRKVRIVNEQRRRDDERKGFVKLRSMLPDSHQRDTKANTLERAAAYIERLEQNRHSMAYELRCAYQMLNLANHTHVSVTDSTTAGLTQTSTEL